MRMLAPLATLLALLVLSQVDGYQCDRRTGTCPLLAGGGKTKCCNPHIFWGVCCPEAGTCCYHGSKNSCCQPGEQCCWSKRRETVKCCRRGTVCCGDRKRGTCCFKTPAILWILLGLCVGIIIVLLLVSIYQCAMEEYAEYQSQQAAGTLPSDNPWYYYDYGSTVRDRHARSAAGRSPPSYEPPPTYSEPPGNAGGRTPGQPGSRASGRASGRPKPPTPQQSGGGSNRAVSGVGSVYYSPDHGPGSGSEYESLPGEVFSPAPEMLYAVPRLQRMLCTPGQCLVEDGSCIHCMDKEPLGEDETNENETVPDLEGRIIDSDTVTNHAKQQAENWSNHEPSPIPTNSLH